MLFYSLNEKSIQENNIRYDQSLDKHLQFINVDLLIKSNDKYIFNNSCRILSWFKSEGKVRLISGQDVTLLLITLSNVYHLVTFCSCMDLTNNNRIKRYKYQKSTSYYLINNCLRAKFKYFLLWKIEVSFCNKECIHKVGTYLQNVVIFT